MEALWVAAIVTVGGILSGITSALLAGWQRSKEKHEDWKRQDDVAARLIASNLEMAAVAAETKAVLGDQLSVIHTLVNSQMTEQKQIALDASIRSLVSLEELVEERKANGRKPKPATLKLIKDSKEAIRSMEMDLADRRAVQSDLEADNG